mgnify:CR=1 FL=1
MERKFFKPFEVDYAGHFENWTDDEEKNKSNTSTVGYVPLVKRVNALLQAGENLESMRASYYGLDSDTDDDEQFEADIVDVSQYDSKLDLMADVKSAEKRISKKLKSNRATKGAKSVVGNSDAPKGAKEELSTTEEAPESERATE